MRPRLFVAAAGLCTLSGFALSACGGGSGSNGGGGNFCTQAAQTVAQFSQISAQFQNTTQTPSVDSFKQLIASADSAFDSLDSNAPSDISSAFHSLRTAFDQANQQVQGVSSFDQMATALNGLDTPQVQQASTQVDDYLQKNCGITPQGAASPS